MMTRTATAARSLDVADQVVTARADVEALDHPDGNFDAVVSFTGLHCFPDPRQALLELGRVTTEGGALSGSTFLRGTVGVPARAAWQLGRRTGLMGPGVTEQELKAWLRQAGFGAITLRKSGPIAYFRAMKRPGFLAASF